MSKIYQDNSLSIGRTPLVRLNRMAQGLKATVLAKIEGRFRFRLAGLHAREQEGALRDDEAGMLGLDMYKMREPLAKAGLKYID